MKKIIILYSLIFTLSCSSSNLNIVDNKKIQVDKIDSVDIYYVFNTNHSNNSIIIGEKEYLRPCLPFPNYIISDSVKTTSILKDGNRKIFIGADGYTIDDIRIKKTGEPVKYIDNCESFSVAPSHEQNETKIERKNDSK